MPTTFAGAALLLPDAVVTLLRTESDGDGERSRLKVSPSKLSKSLASGKDDLCAAEGEVLECRAGVAVGVKRSLFGAGSAS